MKIRLAVSLGDPLGIGPEVVAKALHQRPEMQDSVQIFGDQRLLQKPYIARCNEVQAAEQAASAFVEATEAVLRGEAEALVTAPLHKAALTQLAGGPFTGHTSYLAQRCAAQPLMTFVGHTLRLGLLTIHQPICEVAPALRALGLQGIAERIVFFAQGLNRDFALAQPRIAVLGLNPHASEGGLLGDEDLQLMQPAIALARGRGVDVQGPLPADGFFAEWVLRGPRFDGVLACYHDQGLVGFKTLEPQGAQLSLGLPIVRTSVEHGTARNIAGQDRAMPDSMISALLLADQVARSRQAQTNSKATRAAQKTIDRR